MHFGKINLITPPDSLFNLNTGYLLVKPSNKLKVQFQSILSSLDDDVNVFIYDTDESDLAWMLNAANLVDAIIIDVDNCDPETLLFVSVLLANTNAYYITEDDSIPWNLVSRNRIYNLDWIVEQLNRETDSEDYGDDFEEDDDEV